MTESVHNDDGNDTQYNMGDVRGVGIQETKELKKVGLDSVERIARGDAAMVENANGVDEEQAEVIYQSAQEMVYGVEESSKTGWGRTPSF